MWEQHEQPRSRQTRTHPPSSFTQAPSPAQETSTPPLPWAPGIHRLHPFRNSTIRFYFNKSTRVNRAAAVKGHNSGESCPAFSARVLHGISNVIQTLSPLAFHLFIYGLGQQWPKSLLSSNSCLVVCERPGPAACSAPAPPGLPKSRHKATPDCYMHGDLS